MKSLRWIWLALLVVGLAIALAACGGSKATPQAADTAVPATPRPGDTPVPTSPPQPTDTPVPTLVPTSAVDEELAPDQVIKVTDLNSYRTTIAMTWQGTMTNGQEITASMNMLIEYVREPMAQHMSISGSSLAAQGFTEEQPLEMYIIGDKTYMNIMGQWVQTPSSEGSAGLGDTFLMTSDEVLQGAKNSKYEGQETVNGVDTKHYSFDQTGLNAAEMAGSKVDQVQGDIWIAVDGNYVVKMDATMVGTDMNVPGATGSETLSSGSMHMLMNVTDVNKPITIEVPAEATQASQPPQDIPMPDDAADVTSMLGMTTYTTAKTVQEIHDFYKAQMPNNGWTEASDQAFGDLFMMEYTKDGSKASITITTDSQSGKTSVMITVQ
jgi:hypothetical protein